MVRIFFRTKVFLLREQGKVIWRYYRSLKFSLLDLTIGFCTLFFNPYRTCRKFLEKRGETDVHVYGETPLTAFHALTEALQLNSSDHYIELGSGRGKTCLWAAHFIGCTVEGIEWVPLFARLSQLLARLFRLPAQFYCKSLLDADLTRATVVYLYEFSSPAIPLSQMQPGARLITISEPVNSDDFELMQTVPLIFPWGETEAYIQKKKS